MTPALAGAAAGVRVSVTSAANPGAIGIVQLHGPADAMLRLMGALTGVSDWPERRLRRVQCGDVDEGMAVVMTRGASGAGERAWAELMPHGGLRVMRKLVDHLVELGARYDADPPARDMYPEAGCELEADMLMALSRAASPAAIDLLLAQPALWRKWLRATPFPLGECGGPRSDPPGEGPHDDPATSLPQHDHLLRRGSVLDRLVTPPAVVVIGRPNVGKSTLTNRMLGRAASIVADLPGTTRDWVAGLAQIGGCAHSASGAPAGSAATPNVERETWNHALVAVRWFDTPGWRDSADVIERQAIALARQVAANADVLIALRDPQTDWPDEATRPRRPDLWATNKSDTLSDPPTARRVRCADHEAPQRTEWSAQRTLPGRGPDQPLYISAAQGAGIDALEALVLEALGLGEVNRPELWAFSPTLRRLLGAQDMAALRIYVGP